MSNDKPLIIFHSRCNDGWCCNWLANKALQDADCYPANHGQSPPDVTSRNVYVLDFSYKRNVLLGLKAKAKSLIVIDHHKTAFDELRDLDFCVFNMNKSGARLSWEHFFRGKKAPWLVLYTEDRDLWRWRLPHSREVNAALSSYPMSFQAWDGLDEMVSEEDLRSSRCELVQEGAAILRYQERLNESIASQTHYVKLDEYRVPAVNTSVNFSDAAGKIAKNNPFGVAWYCRADGKFVYSLRSDYSGIDVSEIAKRHGGGGHRLSSGFESDNFILKKVG